MAQDFKDLKGDIAQDLQDEAVYPEGPRAGMEKVAVNEFSAIKNIIAVASGKGGVGKSSVTTLLACAFRKKGFEVGIIDADITGPSVPSLLGIKDTVDGTPMGVLFPSESRTGIKVISTNLLLPQEEFPAACRGPVLTSLVKQFWMNVAWTELDYLFVDLPPGNGDVPLTVMQSLPLSGMVIVTSPQVVSVMIADRAIRAAKQMNIPVLGLVENMSSATCPRCGHEFTPFCQSHGREIAEQFSIPYLGSMPVDPLLSELCDQGKIEEYQNEVVDDVILKRLVRQMERLNYYKIKR